MWPSNPRCTISIFNSRKTPRAGIREAVPAGSAKPPELLRAMAEFDGCAGVFAGIRRVPDAQGISRHWEDQAAAGHLSHAGGPADRYRRKSRAENNRRDRYGIRLHGGNLWAAKAGRDQGRPQQRDPEGQRFAARTRGSSTWRRTCGAGTLLRRHWSVSACPFHSTEPPAREFPDGRSLLLPEELSGIRERLSRGLADRARAGREVDGSLEPYLSGNDF